MNKDNVIGAAAATAISGFAVVQGSRGDLPGVAIDIIGLVIVYAATAGRTGRRLPVKTASPSAFSPEFDGDCDCTTCGEIAAGKAMDRLHSPSWVMRPGWPDDSVPAILSPGRQRLDPEEAEALGLTADAKRLAEGGDA